MQRSPLGDRLNPQSAFDVSQRHADKSGDCDQPGDCDRPEVEQARVSASLAPMYSTDVQQHDRCHLPHIDAHSGQPGRKCCRAMLQPVVCKQVLRTARLHSAQAGVNTAC
jgi:hypothetical protein